MKIRKLVKEVASKIYQSRTGAGSSVIYYDDKGKKWVFEGGTRTWRNQNPGNMVVGDYSRNNGMIGRAGGFAVFPDYEAGHIALLDLLINEYGNFAPPRQNNTKDI